MLKSRQMAAIAQEVEACKAQIAELKTATEPARIKALLDMIEKCVADDRIEQLSFGGNKLMLNAASFTDEWVSTPSGHFRHY